MGWIKKTANAITDALIGVGSPECIHERLRYWKEADAAWCPECDRVWKLDRSEAPLSQETK